MEYRKSMKPSEYAISHREVPSALEGSEEKSELVMRKSIEWKYPLSPIIPWILLCRRWAVGLSGGSKSQHSWTKVQSSRSRFGRYAMLSGGGGSRWCFRSSMMTSLEVDFLNISCLVKSSYCSQILKENIMWMDRHSLGSSFQMPRRQFPYLYTQYIYHQTVPQPSIYNRVESSIDIPLVRLQYLAEIATCPIPV